MLLIYYDIQASPMAVSAVCMVHSSQLLEASNRNPKYAGRVRKHVFCFIQVVELLQTLFRHIFLCVVTSRAGINRGIQAY